MSGVSPARRREVIDALRRGAVPSAGLDLFAVGLDRFVTSVGEDLDAISAGGSVFKAIRGEYGSGKTFFTRWLAERAKRANLATAEVQISENETPLHKLETVYRRLTERLTTATFPPSALRPVVDGWFYALEEDVLAAGDVTPDDAAALDHAVGTLLDQRLAAVSRSAPAFAAALRGYRTAGLDGDSATAEAVLAWLGGQPHVAASARRVAGVRGDLDHFAALSFLQGLLVVLRDSGHPGLLLVLDEVETLQRVRSDARDKALNALRQLIDEVHSGRFPGLYLVITGTPAFYDGPQGVQRLAPLAQRSRSTSPPTPGSTIPAPCRSGSPASPSTRSWNWAAGSGTSTRTVPRHRTVCTSWSTTRTSAIWPGPLPEGSGARSGWHRGCSSRSSWGRCSTASTSSPSSTPASTMRSPSPQRR